MGSKKTYKEETAGHLMVKNIPTISNTATVEEAQNLLLSINSFDTINYLYLLDDESELKGVVSLKDILRSTKETPLSSLSSPKIISVPTNLDQEQIAFLALKNKLKAIPVIDDKNRLVGCVPIDTILQILDSESVENLLRFGGVLHKGSFDNIFEIPLIKSLKHRLPWLLLGLLGGMFAAGVVKSFEATLSKNLILAAFIPLIVYMADAVGTQMEAFIIRDLAVDSKLNFNRTYALNANLVPILA
ncbi:MAG: CBS domain-containing protein [bacterium]